MTVELYQGDCLQVMQGMEDSSIDCIVTDPPYGLSFMGKKWDYDVPSVDIWKETLRVLKPGGTALIFAGSRTQHRMAVNVEDAGFVLKDTIEYLLEPDVQAFYKTLNPQQQKDFISLTGGNSMFWIYGSGFPKSTDISKQIDKAVGVEREIVGKNPNSRPLSEGNKSGSMGGGAYTYPQLTAPATEAAQLWNGYGTALKPAYEPIIIAMKPNEGTYANNALKHGVAGLNIDGCRVGTDEDTARTNGKTAIWNNKEEMNSEKGGGNDKGRFPANIIHDGSDEVLNLFPETHGAGNKKPSNIDNSGSMFKGFKSFEHNPNYHKNNGGSTARFFYCAKASKKERGKGNIHPTVKPLALARYLIRLVKTPENTIVLDNFMGSGTFGVAAKIEGVNFIGIEKDPTYFKIAQRRIKSAEHQLSF